MFIFMEQLLIVTSISFKINVCKVGKGQTILMAMKITKNTVDVVAPNTLSQPRKHLYFFIHHIKDIRMKLSDSLYSSAEVFCQLENIVSLKIKRCNYIIFP